MKSDELINGLPGEELVREGVTDLRAGRETIAACLASIALPRLQRANLIGKIPHEITRDAELRLYRLLRREGGDAYSRYNSLVRRLVSFELALDRRLRMAHTNH